MVLSWAAALLRPLPGGARRCSLQPSQNASSSLEGGRGGSLQGPFGLKFHVQQSLTPLPPPWLSPHSSAPREEESTRFVAYMGKFRKDHISAPQESVPCGAPPSSSSSLSCLCMSE
ncbi:Hypothetical predicted protein [Podarcis lilfordi]|uniref:Uncharacterized protein n=1 Tax=Podarcis lilfordi TaxID=74358 RepID=A0AA35LJP1_9SAUR|nr:Hypothetical predicted protein [Podarcis lilfordi]